MLRTMNYWIENDCVSQLEACEWRIEAGLNIVANEIEMEKIHLFWNYMYLTRVLVKVFFLNFITKKKYKIAATYSLSNTEQKWLTFSTSHRMVFAANLSVVGAWTFLLNTTYDSHSQSAFKIPPCERT